jgi:hypothetical protein
MAPSNLNITEKLGVEYTTTSLYSNLKTNKPSFLYNTLEIYTLQKNAGTVTSSLLIENAGGVSDNSFNPTMVVYNGTSNLINPPLTTQGLIFSISGENVSVGDMFGVHTFDVSGTVGINTTTLNNNYILDVNGNTNINGNLNVTGSITSNLLPIGGIIM